MEYENYLKVFYEEAWTNSLIPFAPDATFLAMKLFGGYNMHVAALIATAGATIGLISNWCIGKLLLRMHVTSTMHIRQDYYDRICHIFNKYLVFVLLFSWVPLCKILLLLAGFLDSRLKFVLPLTVVGQLLYHLSQI